MLSCGPRSALAAFFCASLLTPPPTLAAAVAELGVRPVSASFALPPAFPLAPSIAAVGAPSLGIVAAPSVPIIAASPLAAAAAAPELEPAPEKIPAELAPEQVPGEPKREPLARAREGLRSATRTARALAFLTIGALLPRNSAPPAVEDLLRENQEYAVADKRGALADGAVVEGGPENGPASRATWSHPGLKALLARADAAKAGRQGEGNLLAEVRSAVAAALPRGRDLQTSALERRCVRARKAVELGAYAERGRGGEREAALLANLALGRAGFKPKLLRVSAWRRDNGRVVEEERTLNLVHTARGQVLFDTVSASYDGRKLQDLTAPPGAAGRDAGIVAELDGPRVFTPAGKPKTSGVEVKVSGAKDLAFAVVGRSAADRIFKEDEKRYRAAAPDEKVAVEWLFFPFYADGHTALRVGDRLLEFTRKGWRSSPARAFLFNNPFFDAQLARHPNAGMPPFSFGVPLTIAKRDAERFAALADSGRGWFSFWFNNCNQVPMRFLRRAGIDLGDGAFASFSSIRALRTLLLHPPAEAGAPRLYPLPNQALAAEPLGPAVPRDLVEERSVLHDAGLFVWNWPRCVYGKLPLARRAAALEAPRRGG
jgi:hypothetical protein